MANSHLCNAILLSEKIVLTVTVNCFLQPAHFQTPLRVVDFAVFGVIL